MSAAGTLEARQLWFESPGVAAVRRATVEPPSDGQALVRTIASAVSAGTERLVLRGEVPKAIRRAMTLPTMRGSFELPLSYGYTVVGTVERLGAGAPSALHGARVLALHPHHDRFVIDAAALRPLPPDLPAERLTLGPNLETALNAVWDAGVSIGDRVVVSGLGVIGLLSVFASRRAGAREILGIDPDPARRALALALGASSASAAIELDAVGGGDILFEASGSPAALAALVEGAGPETEIVVLSWYGDRPVPLPLGGSFHPNRVTLRSSQVATLPARRRGRFTIARRWDVVCELLADGALDGIVAPGVPLGDAPALYAELFRGEPWPVPHRVIDHADELDRPAARTVS